MKIVILMGSPNRKGSTSILVDHFVKGATEAGHACEILDVCHMNIHPCTGCVRCGYEGSCVQKDDVEIDHPRQTVQMRHGGVRDASVLLWHECSA